MEKSRPHIFSPQRMKQPCRKSLPSGPFETVLAKSDLELGLDFLVRAKQKP